MNDLTSLDRCRSGARVVSLRCLTAPVRLLNVHSHHPGDAGRACAEQFTRDIYRRAYGARIRAFYPHLLCISDAQGEPVAVAGVRCAGDGPLYVEQYLDQPVDELLRGSDGLPVSRALVAEVGNLAPSGTGQARWLIAVLTGYLHAAGFQHVVFTAVPALYNAFGRLGLPVRCLAEADPARLGADGADEWGSYYRDTPRVCCGSTETGYRLLDRRMRQSSRDLGVAWRQARRLGVLDRDRLHVSVTRESA